MPQAAKQHSTPGSSAESEVSAFDRLVRLRRDLAARRLGECETSPEALGLLADTELARQLVGLAHTLFFAFRGVAAEAADIVGEGRLEAVLYTMENLVDIAEEVRTRACIDRPNN